MIGNSFSYNDIEETKIPENDGDMISELIKQYYRMVDYKLRSLLPEDLHNSEKLRNSEYKIKAYIATHLESDTIVRHELIKPDGTKETIGVLEAPNG